MSTSGEPRLIRIGAAGPRARRAWVSPRARRAGRRGSCRDSIVLSGRRGAADPVGDVVHRAKRARRKEGLARARHNANAAARHFLEPRTTDVLPIPASPNRSAKRPPPASASSSESWSVDSAASRSRIVREKLLTGASCAGDWSYSSPFTGRCDDDAKERFQGSGMTQRPPSLLHARADSHRRSARLICAG
jgi:hypothetical protein